MAIPTRERLTDCDGFRIESPSGLVGWVEETWLGPSGDPLALAVRALDGRRGLLVAEDVEAVLSEGETVVARRDARLLELDAPRIEDGSRDSTVRASWRTTGAVLEPPAPPGLLRQLILARRPWRLAPPPATPSERPVYQTVAFLYAGIVLLAASVMALAFLLAEALA